jgi:hypothetical protein
VRRILPGVALVIALGILLPLAGATAALADTEVPAPSATSSSGIGLVIPDASSGSTTDGGTTSGGSSNGSSTGRSGSGRGTSTAANGGGSEQLPTLATSCISATAAPTPAPAPAASPAATLKLDVHQASQGGLVVATGEGFQPGEKVLFSLYSSPKKLGSFTVRTNGQVIARLTIPASTPTGSHTIEAVGYEDCRIEAAPLEVVSPVGSGSSMFPWIVWLVVGIALAAGAIAYVIGAAIGLLPRPFGARIPAGSPS